MTKWFPTDALRFWSIIAVGSLIGLLGAYGREQHEGRKPDRKWLLLRLCIMPFLALAAAAAADALHLSPQVSAFVAAIFSMLAYDLVRVIRSRTLKRAGDIIGGGDTIEGLALPPNATVELPAGSGPPEVVKVHPTPEQPMTGVLRTAYKTSGKHEPELDRLIERLGDPEL